MIIIRLWITSIPEASSLFLVERQEKMSLTPHVAIACTLEYTENRGRNIFFLIKFLRGFHLVLSSGVPEYCSQGCRVRHAHHELPQTNRKAHDISTLTR